MTKREIHMLTDAIRLEIIPSIRDMVDYPECHILENIVLGAIANVCTTSNPRLNRDLWMNHALNVEVD